MLMSLRAKMIANTCLFQIGWWGCVFGAGWSQILAPITITAVVLALHFAFVQDSAKAETFTILVSTLIGWLFENILIWQLVYILPDGGFRVPVWLICIWILFATCLNYSLKWLRGRYVWSSILGFIFGPISYSAGVGFKLFEIPAPYWQQLFLIGIGWAMLTPLLMFISEWISKPQVAVRSNLS